MQGKRVKDETSVHEMNPGEYARTPESPGYPNGYWTLRLPNGLHSRINPAVHQIIEHEDGTITISPSILVTGGDGSELWHGYLEHGVWRSC